MSIGLRGVCETYGMYIKGRSVTGSNISEGNATASEQGANVICAEMDYEITSTGNIRSEFGV